MKLSLFQLEVTQLSFTLFSRNDSNNLIAFYEKLQMAMITQLIK